MNTQRKLYLAYGANTNHESMNMRCPEAEYVGVTTLHSYKLVFRGVADVVPKHGAKLQVAVWWITPKCERALDRFEGFPNLYVKRYVNITIGGVKHRAMFYVMRNVLSKLSPPGRGYYECLTDGYAKCGMPQMQIENAVSAAKTADAERFKRLQNDPIYKRHYGSVNQQLALAAEEDSDEAEAERLERVTQELSERKRENGIHACTECGSLMFHARSCSKGSVARTMAAAKGFKRKFW